MNDPLAPHQLPGTPPPPPEINRKRLWLSLLLPPGVLGFLMILLVIAASTYSGRGTESTFTMLCIVICLTAIGSWVLFIQTMRQRFRGSSLVLLILAYPIVQFILLFSILFVGCLAAIWSDGLH
ncbi:MAG: hypothetical protein O3A92_13170 [Verrucomicrobia bacterium]|nr:hypothetical protein [Verrucomicrobiota bacterium]